MSETIAIVTIEAKGASVEAVDSITNAVGEALDGTHWWNDVVVDRRGESVSDTVEIRVVVPQYVDMLYRIHGQEMAPRLFTKVSFGRGNCEFKRLEVKTWQ